MKGRNALLIGGLLLTLAPVSWAQMGGGIPRRDPVPVSELGRRLETEGLKGTMHGANHKLGTYVFTWWDPRSFFMSVNFSVAPGNPSAGQALARTERHQEVVIRGKMVANPSAQPHLVVTSVEPGAKWNPGVDVTAPRETGSIDKILRGKQKVDALVHAISDDGSMLVVEIREEVVPVQIPRDPALRDQVKNLYRGDRIRFRFKRAPWPERPVHLVLTPGESSGEPALKVMDSAKALHDQTRTVEGALVLFPRSPVLRRTIWGVEDKAKQGLSRYYTIFNFENMEDQTRIEERLQKAWAATPGVQDARNKYLHKKLRVRVTGKVNNPAANQANPTLVTTADQVTILN